jgi:hypothetical protein
MKKIIFIFIALMLFGITGCEKDNIWGDGLPENEHVYYVSFYKSNADNIHNNYLTYEIKVADGTTRWKYGTNATSGTWTPTNELNVVSVPFEFHSERVRSYDAVSYFWITESDLAVNTNYMVTLENGTALTPNASGAYSLTWPQAKKGVQRVLIHRVAESDATGNLKLNILNPALGDPNPQDLETLVNNKASEYEIRGTSSDFNRTTVTFN